MTRIRKPRRKGKSGSRMKKEDAMLLGLDPCELALLRELYYWSREPGFLEIVRACAGMPEDARAAVEAFAVMAHDHGTITAAWDSAGRLVLASPQVGHTIAIAQHCAEHDDTGTPPLLH